MSDLGVPADGAEYKPGQIGNLTALPAVTNSARALIDEDDTAAAWRLLTRALVGFRPATAPRDGRLLDAALAFAGLRVGAPEWTRHDTRQLQWAEYAAEVIEHEDGTGGRRWQDAQACYLDLLYAQHYDGDAVSAHGHRLHACQQHGKHPAIPSARRALALALHAEGACEDAAQEIRAALWAWRNTPGITAPSGAGLLRTYLSIVAGCGLDDQVRIVLAEDADLFGPPDSAARYAALQTAARQVHAVEAPHRQVCQLGVVSAVPPFDTAGDSFRYWAGVFTASESPAVRAQAVAA